MIRKLTGCFSSGAVDPGAPLESAEETEAKKQNYKASLASAKQQFNERYNGNPCPKISIDDYKVSGLLSHGHFGTVVKAKHNSEKTTCAIKVQLKEKIMKENKLESVKQEKKILQAADNPFIIKLLGAGQDFANVYLVLEFAPNGDLTSNDANLSNETVRHFAAQIVLALEYLHTCGVIYRDLKPQNVLLFDEGVVKLSDFGLAKQCDGTTKTICGDVPFRAPEILLKKPYGHKVDWWAFGVTLHILLLSDPPFSGVGDQEHMKKICESEFVPDGILDGPVRELLQGLLNKDPSKRLGEFVNGEVDVKSHAYFKDVVFVHLIHGMKKIPVPKMSPKKLKDVDMNKVFPEHINDTYRAQFADLC